ncbi:flagellar biosynthesis protein FlgL [Gemmobacter aquarius]|uniref:Flagellar biosynthesis protein FlgL n=1 Tax=Paragemmobacter aquarius TaxID=2169400 RepID=A0A2S0UQK3_9RHOB|nr:flagellin [Gemmobacter aquarius]AWB50099.1 flagellar biosynthesis protein FlgL [Gemmobacter aquarius]
MGLTSIGDLAQSLVLKRQNTAAKADLQRLSTMLTTGKVTDASTHLRGNLAPLAALDATLSRLEGYAQVTAEASRNAAAVQDILGLVDKATAGLGPALLTAGQGGAGSILTGAALQADQVLDQIVSALNTRVADRSLLAGVADDRPALVDTESLLAQAAAAVAGAVGAAGVDAALQDWLDDPAGFVAQAYRGDAPRAPLPVAEGEVARLDVTAADPALRGTLKGVLMGALLNRGVLAGQPQARADLARRAGETLAESAPDRAHLAARVGIAQQRIEAAAARNSAEATTLAMARGGMVGVDGYDTATALQEAQTRLETLYTLTARLSRLNLSDYL